MEVNVPILSVVCLCEDGNGLWITKHGGEIVNLKSGARMKFQKLQGVYHVKIRIDESTAADESQPLFMRPEP